MKIEKSLNGQESLLICTINVTNIYKEVLEHFFKTAGTKLMKNCYSDVLLKFVFRSPKCALTLFTSLTCSGCSTTYYGKTSHNLRIHCREHLGVNKHGQGL